MMASEQGEVNPPYHTLSTTHDISFLQRRIAFAVTLALVSTWPPGQCVYICRVLLLPGLTRLWACRKRTLPRGPRLYPDATGSIYAPRKAHVMDNKMLLASAFNSSRHKLPG